MENKRPFIYLPIFFALTLILGIFLGTTLIPALNGRGNIFSLKLNHYDKFNDVMNYIQNDYVDTISKNNLTEKSLNSLLGRGLRVFNKKSGLLLIQGLRRCRRGSMMGDKPC